MGTDELWGLRQQTQELDGLQGNEGSRRSARVDGQQVVFREDGTLALKSCQVEWQKSHTQPVHTQRGVWVGITNVLSRIVGALWFHFCS